MRVENGRCKCNIPFIICFSALIYLVYILGNAEAHSEKVTAIGIIERCKQSGDEYKTLSETDQEVLLALLQENHAKQDKGIIGKPNVAQQDIQTTMDHVTREVCIQHIQ